MTPIPTFYETILIKVRHTIDKNTIVNLLPDGKIIFLFLVHILGATETSNGLKLRKRP